MTRTPLALAAALSVLGALLTACAPAGTAPSGGHDGSAAVHEETVDAAAAGTCGNA